MTDVVYEVQWARSEEQAKAMQAGGWQVASCRRCYQNHYALLLERGIPCANCGSPWRRDVAGVWRPSCDCGETLPPPAVAA